MKENKTVETTFQVIEVANKNNSLGSTLHHDRVTVGAKDIFLGRGGNWRLKFKDLVKVEVNDDDACVLLETEQKLVTLIEADQETWLSFEQFLLKRWAKLQNKDTPNCTVHAMKRDPIRTRPVTNAQRSRKRNPEKVYGNKHTRHQNILLSHQPNQDLQWSDDERDDDLSIEPLNEQEEETPDMDESHGETAEQGDGQLDDKNDDEMTVLMEDDDETMTSPPLRANRPKKSRIQRKRFIEDDDSDNEIFGDSEMTTPAPNNRLVTPHTRVLVEEDDGHDDGQEELENQETPSEKAVLNDQKKIHAFFQPKPATKPPKVDTTSIKNVTSSPKRIKTNLVSATLSHTPLKRDNASWIEQTQSTTPSRSTTPARRPLTPVLSPITSPPPDTPQRPRSASRYYGPFKRGHDGMEEIDDESDTEIPVSHKRSRVAQRRFPVGAHRRGFYSSHTADHALGGVSSSATPRKSPLFTAASAIATSVSPLQPKQPPRWKGLRNLGNTCYLNASLQLLYSVPDFITRLIGHGSSLIESITKVAASLEESSLSTAVSPHAVKVAVDAVTDRFTGYEQRDAHEFLSDLIDRVHDELEEVRQSQKGTADDTTDKENQKPVATDDFFRMNIRACLKCDSCGYERTMDELYRHLSIAVDRKRPTSEDGERPKWTVGDGMKLFFEPEQREVKCEKCKEGTTATQTHRITSRPNALILHLKRFVVTEKPQIKRSIRPQPDEKKPDDDKDNESPAPVEMIIQKNKDPVVIPETFDLNDYLYPAGDSTHLALPPTKYNLKAIVHHHGTTPLSGHYTADTVRVDEKSAEWVSFDDGQAELANIQKLLKSPFNQASAYLLLYTLDG